MADSLFDRYAFGPGRVCFETTIDGRVSRQSLNNNSAAARDLAHEMKREPTLDEIAADFVRRVTRAGGTARRVNSPSEWTVAA